MTLVRFDHSILSAPGGGKLINGFYDLRRQDAIDAHLHGDEFDDCG